jgi:hypothetical protein
MVFKLAKSDLQSEPRSIELEEIEDLVNAKEGESILYFDRENSEKAFKKLVQHFNKKLDVNVYIREVKFGLDEKDLLYEIHFL